jgi:hypothetical protein
MIAFILRPVRILALAGLSLIVAAALPAQAQTAGVNRTEIQSIIKDYLVTNPDVLREALFAHPEVLRDALTEMERRQKADEETARTKAVASIASRILPKAA